MMKRSSNTLTTLCCREKGKRQNGDTISRSQTGNTLIAQSRVAAAAGLDYLGLGRTFAV